VFKHPTRYYGTGHLRFINCSCYRRQPRLASRARRDWFLRVLEEVRQRYKFVVVGYVVMPDHIHLLISEPEKGDPSKVMQAIKQGFARRVLRQVRRRRQAGQETLFGSEPEHVWQRAGFRTSTFGANANGSRSCGTCTAMRWRAVWWTRRNSGPRAAFGRTRMERSE
jgi:REP element-mobilizing transposase RayT